MENALLQVATVPKCLLRSHQWIILRGQPQHTSGTFLPRIRRPKVFLFLCFPGENDFHVPRFASRKELVAIWTSNTMLFGWGWGQAGFTKWMGGVFIFSFCLFLIVFLKVSSCVLYLSLEVCLYLPLSPTHCVFCTLPQGRVRELEKHNHRLHETVRKMGCELEELTADVLETQARPPPPWVASGCCDSFACMRCCSSLGVFKPSTASLITPPM